MGDRYYPIFIPLGGRVCLVVGGGAVGERKARKLLEHGARVRLVARHLTPWLEEQSRKGAITFIAREYDGSQLAGVHLVFAASSDPDLNRRIAADALSANILCNMATDPELGSFIVPAVFRQGPLTIAVSTAGLSPALARQVRKRLEKQFGPEWATYLMLLGMVRAAVQAKDLGTVENQRIFRELVELPLIDWIQGEKQEEAVEALLRVCGPCMGRDEMVTIWMEAWKSSSLQSPFCVTSSE